MLYYNVCLFTGHCSNTLDTPGAKNPKGSCSASLDTNNNITCNMNVPQSASNLEENQKNFCPSQVHKIFCLRFCYGNNIDDRFVKNIQNCKKCVEQLLETAKAAASPESTVVFSDEMSPCSYCSANFETDTVQIGKNICVERDEFCEMVVKKLQ